MFPYAVIMMKKRGWTTFFEETKKSILSSFCHQEKK